VRDKATTRRRLSEAALLLFATQGYDNTTTRQIAEAADVTERSFFKHFAVKADAIVDLSPEDLDLLTRLIVSADADLPDVAVVQRAVTEWHLRFDDMDAFRQRTRLMVQASQRSVVIRGLLSDYRDLSADTAARALANRHGHSVPGRDTRLLASIVLKAHQDIIREWIQGEAEFAATAHRFYDVLNGEFAAAAASETESKPTQAKARSNRSTKDSPHETVRSSR
jgi:TetR/AcrR family transcriptional regulator, regulator of mycofactocin system